jgi:hypothetical protein
MQTLSVALLLIGILTILGPIVAVAIIYHDDLSQTIITPQLKDLLSTDSSLIPSDNYQNDNNTHPSGKGSSVLDVLNPVFISAKVNDATLTFKTTLNVTNNADYDLTVNSFNADVQITDNRYPAGTISLHAPVTVLKGQTTQVTIAGQYPQAVYGYITGNYPNATSVKMYLTDVNVDVNGVTLQYAGPIDAGSLPIEYEG